jgi:ABC-type uncharacterized transport system auxiliary subunit
MSAKKIFRGNPVGGIFFWLPVVLVLALSACMPRSTAPRATYFFTLDYPPPSAGPTHQLPVVLRVERFSVSPPFQTQRMVYGGEGRHRNTYAYHQWIAPPGDLLPYFLVRDLRQTNGFKAVLTPGTSLSATHSLYGWVEEFMEKDGSNNAAAVATLHITLIDNLIADPVGKIMLQKRYHASVPCRAETPAALAESMSQAMAEISSEIAIDIHRRLSSAHALKY